MFREDLPTMPVKDVKSALDLDHYILSAYDSIEPMNFKIVVVIPSIDGPTWVLAPRARKARRATTMALAIPSLDALTLDIARLHTGVMSSFITLYTFEREDRRAGRMAKGQRVPEPWGAHVPPRVVRSGCFVCKKESVAVNKDGTLRRHGDGASVCDGSGKSPDPHYFPEAREARTCGACDSTNRDCGDNGCCDHCRYAERTACYERTA